MNILFLYRVYPEYGGVEIVTTVLAKRFVKDGHKVWIASFEQPHMELAQDLPADIRLLKLDYPIVSNRNVEVLKACIASHRIDIIVNQWGLPYKTTRLCNKAIAGSACRLVSVLHGSPYTSKVIIKAEDKVKGASNVMLKSLYAATLKAKEAVIKWSIRYAVAHNRRYILLSKGFIEPLIKYAGIKDASNIVAIGNPVTVPVDLDGFCLESKKKQLLYVGRMDYENKRVNRIVESWEMIAQDYPDWELVLVGDGPHKQALMDYVRENHICNVRFEGFRKEPPIAYYKEASIFLLTSDLEGFGLVIIESMSYGVVPIVYGSYEAVYDIIRDGVSGFITPMPYDNRNTADRLRTLIAQPERRQQMAVAAMADAGRFTIDSIAAEWYKLFDSVLSHESGQQ